MFISDFAIKRPIVTVCVMLALAIFGVFALVSLQTDEFPEIQPPIVAVTIVYPGASPEVVEREVVDPLEDAFFSISGIDGKKSTSSATDGLAQFVVYFEFEKGVEQASQDIRDAISSKRGDLPQEIEEPILTRFDPADEPVISLSLTSERRDAAELTSLADPGITRELRGLPGVAQVTVVGGQYPEMTVQLDPARLQAAGIGIAQVVGALQTQNLAAPVGRIEGKLSERTIRLQGRLQGAREFEQVVVAQRGGAPIRLGEVAQVFAGTEEARTAAYFDGRQAVGLEVLKSRGHSTTEVAQALRERVAQVQARLPEGVRLEIVRDAGVRVGEAVENVQRTLLEGALLTVLVVFLFLNSWRSTVITGLTLPVSVLAAFVAVWAFGFTLNTMSLLGLSLAIGILVDDAIVVRENIVRHVEMGRSHLEAAREGTDQIGLAVAATTFSIVAVFAPVAFMYGVAGQWFKPFALTIAIAVLVSLFVSFSLDPMLSAYWPDPPQRRRGPLGRAVGAFNRWFDRGADRYRGVIAWALDHRGAMLLIGGLAFFGALFLQATVGGAGFVPVSDRGEITFVVETPPGSNLEYTQRKTEEAARLARRLPEVAYTYATIGVPIPLRAPGVDQAQVYVRLKPKAERERSQQELGELLRRQVTRIGGAQVSVFTSGFGGAFKQIQLEMRGPDARELNRLAERVQQLVRETPGASDVGASTRGQKPELVVELDRGLAGSLGVTMADVAQALRPAFAGIDAGDWVDPTGETRDVVVRLAPGARERPADLARLPLVLPPSGLPQGSPAVVPLGQVARIRQALGPAQIDHLDRDRVINVQANTQGRSLTEVTQDIDSRLAGLALPPGYRITQGGEAADQAEVFGNIFLALGVALVLMYLILVIQFGSFLDPLAILISLPLSLIGVVLALLATGDTLNIMSLIGVMLLMGIVAKNAILLIDFAKWSRERGATIRDALIEAGRIRLRPIVMTTVAIVAGMIPVAVGAGEGGDFRAPLGRAVIGGVITSTLLTLLVIPTVYEVMDGWRTRTLRLLRRLGRRSRRVQPTAEPAPAPERLSEEQG